MSTTLLYTSMLLYYGSSPPCNARHVYWGSQAPGVVVAGARLNGNESPTASRIAGPVSAAAQRASCFELVYRAHTAYVKLSIHNMRSCSQHAVKDVSWRPPIGKKNAEDGGAEEPEAESRDDGNETPKTWLHAHMQLKVFTDACGGCQAEDSSATHDAHGSYSKRRRSAALELYIDAA